MDEACPDIQQQVLHVDDIIVAGTIFPEKQVSAVEQCHHLVRNQLQPRLPTFCAGAGQERLCHPKRLRAACAQERIEGLARRVVRALDDQVFGKATDVDPALRVPRPHIREIEIRIGRESFAERLDTCLIAGLERFELREGRNHGSSLSKKQCPRNDQRRSVLRRELLRALDRLNAGRCRATATGAVYHRADCHSKRFPPFTYLICIEDMPKHEQAAQPFGQTRSVTLVNLRRRAKLRNMPFLILPA